MGGLILSPFITPLHQNTAKVCLSRLLSVVVDLEVLPIKPRTYYILSPFLKKNIGLVLNSLNISHLQLSVP